MLDMRMVQDREAAEKMRKSLVYLITRHPFFGTIALGLKIVESYDLPTLGTDATYLLYNPDFVKKLSEEVLHAAVAHEVMHVVLLHPFRKGERNAMAVDQSGHTVFVWNLATDFALNPFLKESGFKLGDDWCYDQKYEGMSADEIYHKLLEEMKNKPSITITMDMGGNGAGNGSGSPHEHSKGGKWQHEGCGCGGVLQPKFADSAEAHAREFKVKAEITKAAAVARSCGKLPGSIKQLVDTMLESKVPWTTLLAAFLERHAKNDYTWLRPNTRHLQRGFYTPTLHNMEMGPIAFCVDTSGSVSDDELNQFFSESQAILQQLHVEKLVVIQCDAVVNRVDELSPSDLPVKLEAYGRGGTNFIPPFMYVDEEDVNPDVLVYLTDGECGSFPPEPPYPVFWVVTNNKRFQPPFGETVFM